MPCNNAAYKCCSPIRDYPFFMTKGYETKQSKSKVTPRFTHLPSLSQSYVIWSSYRHILSATPRALSGFDQHQVYANI